jgi:two-component system chemotaxis response regulator CheY
MVGMVLREAGYQVVEAQDGQEALQRLDEGEWHLLVTDVNMPGLDGIELVRRIKADRSRQPIPVLMLTTQSDAASKARGAWAGADAWMVKPFKPDRLVEMVRRVIP